MIAHSFTDLLSFATGTPDEQLPRMSIQCAIVLLVLLPLCLMPSLKPLAAASMFGMHRVCDSVAVALANSVDPDAPAAPHHARAHVATFRPDPFLLDDRPGVTGTSVTALAMLVRLLDGSYEPEGAYFEVVRWTPVFEPSAATDVASASASASAAMSDGVDGIAGIDGIDGIDGVGATMGGAGGGGPAAGGAWWGALAAQLAVAPSAGNLAFFLSLTSNACAGRAARTPPRCQTPC